MEPTTEQKLRNLLGQTEGAAPGTKTVELDVEQRQLVLVALDEFRKAQMAEKMLCIPGSYKEQDIDALISKTDGLMRVIG